MPRKKGDARNYSEINLIEAIACIKNKTMSYREASKEFNIPLSTLCDRMKDRVSLAPGRAGPKTNLTADQENSLVELLLTLSKIGYGVTRHDVPDFVKNILEKAEENGYVIPENKKFMANRPSMNWVYRFMSRHPEVSARTPENLGFQRTYVTEEVIRRWFLSLEKFLQEEHSINATEFFCTENSIRIFNLDESGFPLQGTAQRLQVVAEKGIKNIYRIAPDTKEQVTILACVAANGSFQNPMVVYPGKRHPKFNFNNVNPDDYSLGHSSNGWMTAKVFFTWLSSIFFPSIKDSVEFPIVLFLDGHTSHLSLPVIDFCTQNNIILYCFPPHASHVLQPLDVTVFGPLKKLWNKSIDHYRQTYRTALSRANFLQVFDVAWKACIQQPQNVISGFRSCGLVPFDVNRVNFSKIIDQKTAKKYNDCIDEGRSSTFTSSYEKLGVVRVFKMFENELTDQLKRDFEKRYDEKYDLQDTTDKGILWTFYKKVRKVIGDVENESDINVSNAVHVQNEQEERYNRTPCETAINVSSPPRLHENIPIQTLGMNPAATGNHTMEPVLSDIPTAHLIIESCSVPSLSGLEDSSQGNNVSPVPSPSGLQNLSSGTNEIPVRPVPSGLQSISLGNCESPVTGPSGLQNTSSSCTQVQKQQKATGLGVVRKLAFDNFAFSPYKKYLKIPDHFLIGKKDNPRIKLRTPPAVTGKEYHVNLIKSTEEKMRLESEKQKRKREREHKKSTKEEDKKKKQQTNSKKRTDLEENSDEENIEIEQVMEFMDSDSDLENLGEFDQMCAGCEGNEGLNETQNWIGCKKCPRWFHKTCLSDDIELMTPDELEQYHFVCSICEKLQLRTQKRLRTA